MLNRIKKHIEKDFPELLDNPIFLAISGGKDSVALCYLLVQLRLEPVLLHCNYKLRGAESDKDELFVKELAAQLNLECRIKNFNNSEIKRLKEENTQLVARQLRYQWFQQEMDKTPNAFLVTAHHLDDSIESVFINLLRGTGIKGLKGIPSKSKHIVRPLLNFTQKDIIEYIEENNILFRSDASNFETKYRRNQIRHNILPELEKINSDFQTKFRSTIKEINNLNEWIEFEVHKFTNQFINEQSNYSAVQLSELNKLHTFFLFKLFENYGVNRSKRAEFQKFLVSSTGKMFITKSHEFLIDRENLLFRPVQVNSTEEQFTFQPPCVLEPYSFAIKPSTEINLNSGDLYIAADCLSFPLQLRKFNRNGDKFTPYGSPNSKLISDLLIDLKVNNFEKDNVFILEDSNHKILAVLPYKSSNDFKITNDTKEILLVKLPQ